MNGRTMLLVAALAVPTGASGQDGGNVPARDAEAGRTALTTEDRSLERAGPLALGMGARENPFSRSTAGDAVAAVVAVANLRFPWKSALLVEPEVGLWVEEENRKPFATCSGLPCATRTHIANLGVNLIFAPRLGSWGRVRLGGGWAVNVQHDTGRPSLWAVAGGLNVQAGLDVSVSRRAGVFLTARGDAVGRFALGKVYLGAWASRR